jgi:hypothetical protein
MGQFQVKRISAQFNLIVPPNLSMIADMNALKKTVIVPGAKNAFSRESG